MDTESRLLVECDLSNPVVSVHTPVKCKTPTPQGQQQATPAFSQAKSKSESMKGVQHIVVSFRFTVDI